MVEWILVKLSYCYSTGKYWSFVSPKITLPLKKMESRGERNVQVALSNPIVSQIYKYTILEIKY